MIRLLVLLGAVLSWAAPAFAVTGGSGVSATDGVVTTDSTSANFLANASSLSCSSSPGKLIVDSTADALSYCSSGGSTVKYAALGNDSGDAAGIVDGTIVNVDVNASAAIALSKLANIASDRLLGRDTASSGAIEELTVGGGVEFSGSTGIQRSALTGDVTASAGSNTTAIASGVIVNADVNASAAIDVSKTALVDGAGLLLSTNTLATASTETNFLANAASVTCSSSAGRLIVDSTADTLAYCSSGGSTQKWAALGDDSGDAVGIAANTIVGGDIQNGVIAPGKMTESFAQSYAGTGLTFDTTTSPDTLKIAANGVTLATDTAGNFVATVTGTSNEVSVSGSGSEDAAVTVSLPSTIDLGGKTSLELPNGSAPTTNVFGQIAGDNNAWAASRGAPQWYDGTANTYLVGALVSDTPADGQVPKWNTGGTVTWEDDSGNAESRAVDVRDYGAACDNSADDGDNFSAAYTDLTTTGGTIIVPAGKTCIIEADVAVKSNVTLRCEPGAILKAKSGGTFTLGVFEWLSQSASNSSVVGCSFDLNGKATAAVLVFGGRQSVTRSRFYGGATSNGSNWSLANFSCSGEACEFAQNQITCGNTSGAKDIGATISGSTTAGEQTLAQGNTIKNCDITGLNISAGKVTAIGNSVATSSASASAKGILVTPADAEAIGNTVTCAGSTSTCIEVAGASAARANRITASGSSAVGILLSAAYADATSNKLTVSGTTGIAIKATSVSNVISANSWQLTADTGGTDAAIGVKLGAGDATTGQQYVVTGNFGNVTTTDAQVHVATAAPLAVITGNLFSKGAYCFAPSQASGAEGFAGYNAQVVGNRCYSPGIAGAVAVTGWELVGNYIAWVASGGTAAIIVSDNRTYKNTTTHTNITGNLLHSQQSSVIGIKFDAPNSKVCQYGTAFPSNLGATCTVDGDCSGGGTGSCQTLNTQDIQIVGNQFLLAANNHGASIDFSGGVGSTSGNLLNVVVTGNTFETNTTSGNSTAAIKCPSSNQSKMTRVAVGTNSYYGYVPVTGDTTKGRMDINCTPDMVDDDGTQAMWFPAAGCNNTTGYPVFDLGTTAATRPTAACKQGATGGDYWGALDFADGSNEMFGFINFMVPGPRTYSVWVRPTYTVNAANTLVTRWGFTGRSIASDAGVMDTSFSGTEATIDSSYGNNANQSETPSSYATMGDIMTGNNTLFSMRVRRLSNHANDTQTNTVSLYGVTVWLRKMD